MRAVRADTRDELLTLEECRVWAEKFGGTPFNMLALAVASEGQPGPMKVMRSLFHIAAELERELDEARLTCAVEYERGVADGFKGEPA